VRDVRDGRSLARLSGMLVSRKKKCAPKSRTKLHG
jgi:hypothetical protein